MRICMTNNYYKHKSNSYGYLEYNQGMIENATISPIRQQENKERLLRNLETEPLKYALDIANVKNAEELIDKLMQYDTKAQFEKVFEKLKVVSAFQ